MLTRREQIQRLELTLVMGGTLGLSTIMLLRMTGKDRAANLLMYFGVIAGGVLGSIAVAQGSTRFR